MDEVEVVVTPPNWEMMNERWESVWSVWRDSDFGVGIWVKVEAEGDEDKEKEEGGMNTVVESMDSDIMIVVNRDVLSIVHICIVNSLDSGANTTH